MTTQQIAKLYKARRSGRGKWMARCPVHRDRMASLEIKEGKNAGSTIVGCYAGCSKDAVLAAVGLTMRDLFAGSMPDREALRLAERLRAEEERQRKAKRRREREAIDRARKWEACRDALGFLLIQRPEDSKLASLFHHACNMSRELPSTGYFDGDTDLRDVFPEHHPLDGITCQDVGRQVGRYLRLPNE